LQRSTRPSYVLVHTQAGRFNYVARVSAHQDSLCTGTLISDNVVLTAAHCFEFRPLTSPRPFASPIIDPTVTFGMSALSRLCLPMRALSGCHARSGQDMWHFSVLHDAGYNITAPPTVFPAIPPTAAAIHPLYTKGSSEYDIAVIRIDQNNYTGPEPTFFPTPIKHRAQGDASFHSDVYRFALSTW
jgi:hypothetical protein